jgi:hypothetical protein
MALEISNLVQLLTAYGIGVRAGVITPNMEDEVYFRKQMGLLPMNESVKADWKESNNTRHPITTRTGLSQEFEIAQENGEAEDKDE